MSHLYLWLHQVFTIYISKCVCVCVCIFASCRNMDLGNSCRVEHQRRKNFCFLPRHRRIWKRWQVKCVWWPVNSQEDLFSGHDWIYVRCIWLIDACLGFLLWQLFWALSFYITCLKRLVAHHYALLIYLPNHMWKASLLGVLLVERWTSFKVIWESLSVTPGLY